MKTANALTTIADKSIQMLHKFFAGKAYIQTANETTAIKTCKHRTANGFCEKSKRQCPVTNLKLSFNS